MKSRKINSLTVQKWGNSLAVRIPSQIAKSAHLSVGTPVAMSVHNGVITVMPSGDANLTLNERLELFNIKEHGGEAMMSGAITKEVT